MENPGQGADGGVDLRLRKDGKKAYVQCKHWKKRSVGVKVVRELYGIVMAKKADQGIVVSKATVYGYLDQLLGRTVRVYLSLTPTSKKLYRVGVHFPSRQVEKTRKEVLRTLVGKYGRPSFKRKKELFFGETVWRVKKLTEIVLVYGFGSLKVVYKDRALARLKEREKGKPRPKSGKSTRLRIPTSFDVVPLLDVPGRRTHAAAEMNRFLG